MIELVIGTAIGATLYALFRIMMLLRELVDLVNLMVYEGEALKPVNDLKCSICHKHDN